MITAASPVPGRALGGTRLAAYQGGRWL